MDVYGSVHSKPLIRWAGSKRKLLPLLKTQLPVNYKRYVEPFCGSASLFFEAHAQDALLSDLNEELVNALKAIKHDQFLREKLVSLPVTKEEYYRLRAINPKDLNDSERAVRFLYLNRYCFNGVYRTNKSGAFNVPIGTRTGEFPKQSVFDWARERLECATIIAADYKTILPKLGDGDFVYMDPPYSKTTRFTGEYGVGSFSSEELPVFISFLSQLNDNGAKFLFSYRACEEVINELSFLYKVKVISVKRHISGFKNSWEEEKEILVRNF